MACLTDATLHEFVTDQSSAVAEQQIVEHLATCPACAERLDTLGSGELQAAREIASAAGPSSLGCSASACGSNHEPADLREHLYDLLTADSTSWPAAADPTEFGRETSHRASTSSSAAELLRLITAKPTDDVDGARLGKFTVRRWLGAGGFGIVFLADDERLHRQVALKLPRAQSLAHPQVQERFIREAEAAAQLQHPNLIPVFEAGEEQGIHYIASAYCSGPSLDRWLAERTEPVPTSTAVEMVRQLAAAVQYAHQHRVLHRDIKPGNILLESDGVSSLIPKLTDFGLAKLLDSDSPTHTRGVLGTPQYMAPEQVFGTGDAIGPPADVFALGAVLYEMLTGAVPFAKIGAADSQHGLSGGPPPSVRQLRSDVPRDLEAICFKCLEQRPEDRYATAQALADDLLRFAEGQATLARPVCRLERLRRWAIRRPAGGALLLLSVAVLLGIQTFVSTYRQSLESFHSEIRTATDETEAIEQALRDQRTRTERLQYASKIAMVQQAVEDRDLSQAAQLLRDVQAENPLRSNEFVSRYLRNQIGAEGELIARSSADIYGLQFSPTAARLAVFGADGVARVYDGPSFRPLLEIPTGQGEVNGVSFTPDERTIATAGDDGTVRLWDASSGQWQQTIQAHPAYAYCCLFAGDGGTLITCGREPTIRIWDARTGAAVGTLTGHTREVETLALAPDGSQLASASGEHTVRIWDLKSQQTRLVLDGHQGRVTGVQYSSDGRYLLTCGVDGSVRLWRTTDGRCLQIQQHLDPLTSATFLREDQIIASDRGGLVHIWQRTPDPQQVAAPPVTLQTPLHSWKAHEGRGWQVVAMPDGAGMITSGADGRVVYWQGAPRVPQAFTPRPDQEVRDLAFDRAELRLHGIDVDHSPWSWNLAAGKPENAIRYGSLPPHEPQAMSPLPGGGFATVGADGRIRGFSASCNDPLFCLQPRWHACPDGESVELVASRDAWRLALFSFARDATLVYQGGAEEPSLREVGIFEAHSNTVALSNDGSLLAMSDSDDVVVWQIDSGLRIAQLPGHTSSIGCLQFSPDGLWLASGSNDRTVRLWNLKQQGESLTLEGHRGKIQAVAFAPDGRSLASGDDRGELKFWMLPEGNAYFSLEASACIRHLDFSPDGDRLALHSDQQIQILDATPGSETQQARPENEARRSAGKLQDQPRSDPSLLLSPTTPRIAGERIQKWGRDPNRA